jgi:potassium-transporting ATPase KdpC subunit
MKTFIREIRTAILVTVCLTVLLCGVYPAVVWALGQVLFPHEANGSLVRINGEPVCSSLIGQPFSGKTYFHSRPSAAGTGYDASNSGATNLGPLSKSLVEEVASRIVHYREINHLGPEVPVPADAVTASASGLDPHISVRNALLQASRVAEARQMSLDDVKQKIGMFTEHRQLGLLGEPRVNVTLLNLSLDGKNVGR